MNNKHKTTQSHDVQDQSAKKAKRIAAIIYILIMMTIVGGSYLHQQSLQQPVDEILQKAY